MIRGQHNFSPPPARGAGGSVPSMKALGLQPEPRLPSEADLRLELDRNPYAPGSARLAVSECLERHGVDPSVSQTVVLLVSEVVSNAVRHSQAPTEVPIDLTASVTGEWVRIAVADGGRGFIPRRRDPERLSDGYGLYLLEKAATSWGVEDAGGTTVWFELAR
jgi:serine/threonine-protein kinase RsbW